MIQIRCINFGQIHACNVILYSWNVSTYLAMCTSIVDFSQDPIDPVVTGQEDRNISLSHTLLQLDSNGDQLLALVHMEQTDWSNIEVALSCLQTIHEINFISHLKYDQPI